MPGEEYAPGFKMQIHQVKGNAALEVTVDAIQNNLTPDIDYLEIREVRFGNRLVNSLVLLYAAKEIKFGHFWRGPRVVGVPRANLERDVRGDNNRVIAHGFDEHRNYSTFASHPSFNGSSNYGVTHQRLALSQQWTLAYGSMCYSWRLRIPNERGARMDPLMSHQEFQRSPRPSTIGSASPDYLTLFFLSVWWLRRFRG